MNPPVDVDVLVKFALRLSIIFAVIFLLALLTPKMAKSVEGWIKKCRSDRDADETYGFRSIYELPSRRRMPEEEEYDLDEEEEEPDDGDYALEEEESVPAVRENPHTESASEPAPVPVSDEPVYLFSFFKLEETPYDLTLWKVKYRKAVPIDVGKQDFSKIFFGKPRPAETPGPALQPFYEDEEEDAEDFIGDPLIPSDVEEDEFFDDGFFDDGFFDDEEDSSWFTQ